MANDSPRCRIFLLLLLLLCTGVCLWLLLLLLHACVYWEGVDVVVACMCFCHVYC